MTLTIGRRFRGPSTSGNGGYVASLVAAGLGVDVATVTLRIPPPLDVELRVLDGPEGLLLVDGDTTVAEGVPAAEAELEAVAPVPADDAREASASYPGLQRHPFPECFVCGTERAPGDGMRLFPGRLGDGRTACVWTVEPDVAKDPRFVWAALDCPGGWSAPIEGRPMVLGRMTARVADVPEAGEKCVVMGLLIGSEGRKTWTATTAYGADGRELGRAHSTWIRVPTE
ncbi:hypothetical protein F7O44_14055 [Phytoactinopolyspora sp. XMNu-373]|uniref:Thioesterase family protein n=2 Tax=Phytoactinopolyspora mesophila TaxID=2650750 RepID=A0A7K3M581_9ACTN|nr:hypothetical protein [Phytoactinopolyspora mesophila]